MFLEFLLIEGETSGEHVPDGFFDKVCVLIFAPQNEIRSMFLDFL